MSAPIALGGASFSPSPLVSPPERGANALTAPTTPGKRVPVVDRTRVHPEIRKAAEGMEAMFLDYMMKVMRQTVPKNEMDLESPATEIYRGMLDSENAQKAVRSGSGIGLADQIIAYLQPELYTSGKGPHVPTAAQRKGLTDDPTVRSSERRDPPVNTGGTHEGQPDRK
ncbi:MAG: rod-binding protein [Oligoflexia bacterium]|nr:rod-binding protein [Oligoflexia bacterium]